jgi:hypothetical protein
MSRDSTALSSLMFPFAVRRILINRGSVLTEIFHRHDNRRVAALVSFLFQMNLMRCIYTLIQSLMRRVGGRLYFAQSALSDADAISDSILTAAQFSAEPSANSGPISRAVTSRAQTAGIICGFRTKESSAYAQFLKLFFRILNT